MGDLSCTLSFSRCGIFIVVAQSRVGGYFILPLLGAGGLKMLLWHRDEICLFFILVPVKLTSLPALFPKL